MAVISGGPLKGKKTTRDERILDLRLESLGSVGSGGSVALCYDEHVELGQQAAFVYYIGG